MMYKPLSTDFFARDTLTVAKDLLGKHLLRWDVKHKDYIVCRIVETEAYTGDDPSCHAFKGDKGRGSTLFKSPGLAYVYFIYGMYHCLNVVTEPKGQAGAVLFRGVEPVYVPSGEELKTHGPGRLCKALDITLIQNELPLTQDNRELYLAKGDDIFEENIVTTTRIGISKAQDYPWRFYERDNRWVSAKAK